MAYNILKDFNELFSLDENTTIDPEKMNHLEEVLNDFLTTLFEQNMVSESYHMVQRLSKQSIIFSQAASMLDLDNNRKHLQSYYLGYLFSIMQLKNKLDEKNDLLLLSEKAQRLNYMSDILELLYHDNTLEFQMLYGKLITKHKKLTKENLKKYLKKYSDLNLYSTQKQNETNYYIIITHKGRDVYSHLTSKNTITAEVLTCFLLSFLEAVTWELDHKTYSANNVLNKLGEFHQELPITKPKMFKSKLNHLMATASKASFDYYMREQEINIGQGFEKYAFDDINFIDLENYSEVEDERNNRKTKT